MNQHSATELIEQPQNWAKRAETREAVWAKQIDNFCAGVGAGMIAGVLAWVFTNSWGAVAVWSIPFWIGTWGALMLARGSLDEVFAYADYLRMVRDIEALVAQLDEQEAEHDATVAELETKLRILQTDLNSERMRNWNIHASPNSRPAVDLTEPMKDDPVRDDAVKLLRRAFAPAPWGKDAMNEYCKMTSTQWYAARELLIARGIVVRGKNQTRLLQPTLSDALTALGIGQSE